MSVGEGLFGGEVGVDGVGNVDHVDAVGAGADDAETAGPGAGEHARDEMRITDAPDQVWTEGDYERPGDGSDNAPTSVLGDATMGLCSKNNIEDAFKALSNETGNALQLTRGK